MPGPDAMLDRFATLLRIARLLAAAGRPVVLTGLEQEATRLAAALAGTGAAHRPRLELVLEELDRLEDRMLASAQLWEG